MGGEQRHHRISDGHTGGMPLELGQRHDNIRQNRSISVRTNASSIQLA